VQTRPRRIGGRHPRSSSSGDVRHGHHGRSSRSNPPEEQLNPLAVSQPSRSLQDAAFESITANLTSGFGGAQTRGKNFQKLPVAEIPPIVYSRGVYRPSTVTFTRGVNGNVGSSFDDRQSVFGRVSAGPHNRSLMDSFYPSDMDATRESVLDHRGNSGTRQSTLSNNSVFRA